MQSRRLARELALLGMGQLPSKPKKLSHQELEALVTAAVRSLVGKCKTPSKKPQRICKVAKNGC
jgi:N utilization substance protein B